MSSGGEKSGSGKAGAEPRADRLAAALRENLKKRKAQARARQRPEAARATPSSGPKDQSKT